VSAQVRSRFVGSALVVVMAALPFEFDGPDDSTDPVAAPPSVRLNVGAGHTFGLSRNLPPRAHR
jgi:hypothetical protein